MTTETPSIVNRAIAEICGWTDLHESRSAFRTELYGRKQDDELRQRLPNYYGDLNAMHEAEKSLTKDDAFEYLNALGNVTAICSTGMEWWRRYQIVRATAAQRAEAFLRTLGKWVEGDSEGEGDREGKETEEDNPAPDDLPAEHYQDVLRERLRVRDEPRAQGGE